MGIDPDPDRCRARACGLALLDASRAYESHQMDGDEGAAALVLGLVGRARRLLRAAYLLTDEGLELEAASIRRTLMEYMVRVRWLLADPETNVKIWQRDDARVRLLGDDGVRNDPNAPVLPMPADARDTTKQLRDLRTSELKALAIDTQIPGVKTLLEADPMIYAIYRYDSQIGAHPTPIAAEQMLSRSADGHLHLHAEPVVRDGQAEVDTYAACASSLIRLLGMVDEWLPTPMTALGRLETIRAELDSTR